MSFTLTANDITLTTVYIMAKSDDSFNQSIIRFHLRILITVINNDVVFIKASLRQLEETITKLVKAT